MSSSDGAPSPAAGPLNGAALVFGGFIIGILGRKAAGILKTLRPRRALVVVSPVPPDLTIARSVLPLPITDVAAAIGILPSELVQHGPSIAKVSLSILDRLANRPEGFLVVVAGISPTPLGEGKSTTTVGLSQALGAHLGHKVITCIRQPSQGPTFGIKGGAAGGGYAQVVPMEIFNLHLTGDLHAITAANNLLAAQVDARVLHEASQKDGPLFDRLCPRDKTTGERKLAAIQLRRAVKLGLGPDPEAWTEDDRRLFARLDVDPAAITWRRVIDTNDRFLRNITIGQGPEESARTPPRATGFDITVASEVMAVLALTSSAKDMRERLGAMVVGFSRSGEAVTADDHGMGGALTVLMKDALLPTLMQTLEGTPVLVHAGPFANIAHGNSSIVADDVARKLVGKGGFVVTECGFGSDIGLEKFCNIKVRASGQRPDAVVIVATVRALKMHGGGPDVVAGTPLDKSYLFENVDLVAKGTCNLARHVHNASKFGLPCVVAINRFASDTDAELEVVRAAALKAGATAAVVCRHHELGGAGAVELGRAVAAACALQAAQFRFLYPAEMALKAKIEIVAREIYGAAGVDFSPAAEEGLARYTRAGYGSLPVCMAKTQYSFSADAKVKGAPSGFMLPVRGVSVSAGAGFVVVFVGTLSMMPGLPTRPCAFDIDLEPETGVIVGLS